MYCRCLNYCNKVKINKCFIPLKTAYIFIKMTKIGMTSNEREERTTTVYINIDSNILYVITNVYTR